MRSICRNMMDSTQIRNISGRDYSLYTRRFEVATWLLVSVVALASFAVGQQLLTSRGDNTRSGANTNEILLTPSNVNKLSFGHLFSVPVDYQVLAQPLYVPNVTINTGVYAGTVHNVVYVATQMDSLYAFDADNGTQLWYQSEVVPGGTPASGKYLPCGNGGGFLYEGIIGTPVIDLNTTPGTMYLVAKSVFNATVVHYLHAVDITTGLDLAPPVQLGATSVSLKGTVTNFNSLHQKNRPGLLLLNGTLYLGFGSNSCNDSNSGWVLAYDAGPGDPNYLQQVGAFNTSPDIGLTSIWQTGSGLTADEAGNIFLSTAESTNYDVPNGGQSYSDSVLKLTAPPWSAQNQIGPTSQPNQYFSPSYVAYLNSHDLDVSSVGPLVLPDLSPGPPTCTGTMNGTPCHVVVASGKDKQVYVLDRDNMGGYWSNPGCLFPATCDPQILQEFPLVGGTGELMASPAYWNGTIYFAPDGAPIQAYSVTSGSSPLVPGVQTTKKYVGSHAPSISASGNTNGIMWILSGNNLDAFDAVSLDLIYSSTQSGTRDKFPALAHFATQTVANGKVYVATQTTLEAFGLFHIMSITGGNNQTAPVLSPLPAPLQISATDPYTGQPISGVTISFSDGGKGGMFNPTSQATDSNGNVSTIYTFPKKAGAYSLTASAANFGSVVATETATPSNATTIITYSGQRQTGAAGTVLPNLLNVRAEDAYSNPVPGVQVNFSSNQGGVVSPGTVMTNASGLAGTTLQLPTTVAKVTVTASSSGLKNATLVEFSVAGPAASVTATAGNNQSGAAGTTLPQALVVLVTDQYGNPVSGASVLFSDGGEGGTFGGANPGTTGANGQFSQTYTLPPAAENLTITATVPGVNNPAVFSETAD